MTLSSFSDAQRNAWKNGLRVSQKTKLPKACLANVLHVLALHTAWRGVIAYDAFAECVVCTLEPPVRRQDSPGISMLGDWSDEHSIRTAAWLASEADFDAPSRMIDQAVSALSRKRIVHPVRDYLLALHWDCVPRVDKILPAYFATADSPYTRAIGARWMISAVARVMAPGCQADCMLVVEGKQGQKKSTGFEALCDHTEWFADTGVNIGDKDSYQSLRRKWIYEFGELDAIKKTEVTKVKNFVSARSDNYRPSYGIRNRDFPRQVVFAGTTNEDHYLVDRTGNRRFWPVKCLGEVAVEAIRRDRDQLWAETRVRYETGEAWHVDSPQLVSMCEAEQADRQAPEDWIPIVAQWLKHPTLPDGVRDRTLIDISDGITTADVLLGAINMRAAEINNGPSTRAGRVLRELGYEPTPNAVRRNGDRVRVYKRLPDTADSRCADQGVPTDRHQQGSKSL